MVFQKYRGTWKGQKHLDKRRLIPLKYAVGQNFLQNEGMGRCKGGGGNGGENKKGGETPPFLPQILPWT